jgi:hypothetical protein
VPIGIRHHAAAAAAHPPPPPPPSTMGHMVTMRPQFEGALATLQQLADAMDSDLL